MGDSAGSGKYTAFFDLDDTILTTSSGRLWVEYSLRNGEYSLVDLFQLGLRGMGYRAGLFHAEEVIREWARSYRGTSWEKLQRRSREFFESEIRNHYRDSVVAEIRRHQRAGAHTVMLSASTQLICEPIAQDLGLTDLLCTRLAHQAQIVTGEFDGPYVYGREKLNAALEYLREHSMDPDHCWYYGDSHADRWVLGYVGHAVCVKPGRRLKSLASKHGWDILDT